MKWRDLRKETEGRDRRKGGDREGKERRKSKTNGKEK
jgi:hypothetical protein